jgi:hypothetical protein
LTEIVAVLDSLPQVAGPARITTHFISTQYGGNMACLACSSENQQSFSGELIVAFPGLQRLDLCPVYSCQKMLVCLDCGYTELIVPDPQLEKLKNGMDGVCSRTKFVTEYSRLGY